MSRPSEPLLRWLRARIDARGENTASLAQKLGRPKGEVRRLLTGSLPMLVDDLLQISQVLEVQPDDLGVGVPVDEAGAEVPEPGRHWDNQAEVLLRVAFDHGIDVLCLLDVALLDGVWGGPDDVLSRFRERELPVGLDAAYHPHMQPEFSEQALEVTLSFDKLYRCTLPWAAFRRVVFTPLPVDAPSKEPDEGGSGPHLRLV